MSRNITPNSTSFTSLSSGREYEVCLEGNLTRVHGYGGLSGCYLGEAFFFGGKYTNVQDAVRDLINYFERGGTLNFEIH